MGKKDTWTPKALANRQKAKGLGRLRWYCQMCEKQCRDANGFKCHTQSEGHIRQMSVFKSNSGRFMDEFSRDFERDFVSTLSQRHNTKRVKANNVYQEMIQDRHHVHMNATFWGSLSAFIKHLGQKGVCLVEDTDEGWFITWIDRDPKTLARMSEREKRKQSEMDGEERHQIEIQRQMDAAKAFAEANQLHSQEAFTELKPSDAPIKLDLGFKAKSSNPNHRPKRPKRPKLQQTSSASKQSSSKPSSTVKATSTASAVAEGSIVRRHNPNTQTVARLAAKRKQSKEEIAQMKEKPPATSMSMSKSKTTSTSEFEFVEGCWLTPGIVVKLCGKKVPSDMYKKKAVVVASSKRDVGYGQVCQIQRKLNTIIGEPFRIKQSQVETVLPKLGGEVVLVSKSSQFRHIGARARLLQVDTERFCVDVKLKGTAEVVEGVSYDNVCKAFR